MKTARSVAGLVVLMVAAVAIVATSPVRWSITASSSGSIDLPSGASSVTRSLDVSLQAAPREAGNVVNFQCGLSTTTPTARASVEARFVGESSSGAPRRVIGSAPVQLWSSRRCPPAGPCTMRVDVTVRRGAHPALLEPVSVSWSASVSAGGIGDHAPPGASLMVSEVR